MDEVEEVYGRVNIRGRLVGEAGKEVSDAAARKGENLANGSWIRLSLFLLTRTTID